MPNGKAPTVEETLGTLTKLIQTLVETVEDLRIQQEEINERIINLGIPGLDYEVEES